MIHTWWHQVSEHVDNCTKSNSWLYKVTWSSPCLYICTRYLIVFCALTTLSCIGIVLYMICYMILSIVSSFFLNM